MRFIALFLLLITSTIHAQQSTVHWGDNGKAKNYFIYKVGKGETLSAIARKYNVSVEAIKNLNPKLQTTALGAGQTIRIPVKKAATSSTAPMAHDSLNHSTAIDTVTTISKPVSEPIVYVVKKGDTYSSILKKNKITDQDAFDKQNHLKVHTLKIGQKLIVGEKILTPAPTLTPVHKSPVAAPPPPNPRYSAKALADCSSESMYVYTSQYPLGTELIVINPANKKAANVVVTADKPDMPDYQHVQMLLSCALARHLEFDASQTQVEVVLRK